MFIRWDLFYNNVLEHDPNDSDNSTSISPRLSSPPPPLAVAISLRTLWTISTYPQRFRLNPQDPPAAPPASYLPEPKPTKRRNTR